MRNLRLDICYDGTRYRGWQRLQGVENTIQGKLEQTLSRILGEEVDVSGSGRTDAGAHAAMQVANFHCQSAMSCQEILIALRRYLPEDIGIYSCREVSGRFHARLNCKTKTYRYRIWNSDVPCVFEKRFVYPMSQSLDLQAMELAAAHLLGEHDFSAFCSAGAQVKSKVRTIYEVSLSEEPISNMTEGRIIRIRVRGNGFLYNMVRIIAGTLLDVGMGRRTPQQVWEALQTGERQKAGPTAPPQGLMLVKIEHCQNG